MAKKFEKKLLSSAMAMALVAGFGVAGNASAIMVDETGDGQVLLAPYYTVQSGYKTKFAIVNTRDDAAVKVKVVFRSKAQSTEVLDFICYMSPADVCRFEVEADASGQAVLKSSDDSVRSSPTTFSNQTPASQPLFDQKMLQIDKYDINEVGHVEIIGAYAVTGTINVTGKGNIVVKRGMSKANLLTIFDAGGNGGDRNLIAPALAVNPASVEASDQPALVQLTGTVEIVKADGSDRMGYRIPALDQSAAGLVIANANFDVNVGVETSIGNRFGVFGTDNIVAIEQALASSFLKGVYENSDSDKTDLLVTFPTKYRHRTAHICTNLLITKETLDNAWYTPPFERNGTVKYTLTSYDNMENTVTAAGTVWSGGTAAPADYLLSEVNLVSPSWPYASGWYNLGLNQANGLMGTVPGTTTTAADSCATVYAGMPALGMTWGWMTGAHMNSTLIPATH